MPQSLVDLLANPVVLKVIFAFWIYSAFVGALPTPEAGSYKIYQFFFRFAHLLSGNLNRAAIVFKIPGVEPEEPK